MQGGSEEALVAEFYLGFDVKRVPAAGLWVAVEHAGDAVESAEYAGTNEVRIVFKSPATLGAGVYQSTVTLNVCRDEFCATHVADSPATIPVTLTVTDPADKAPLADTHVFGHDVVDAEYSAALDAIVMVSASPSPALYLYDPVTQTAQSVALGAVPQAVSVGPDGLSAAVGHDELITLVNLADIEGANPKTLLDLSTDLGDIVLAGDGYVHALPRTAQGLGSYHVRSVNIAMNTEYEGGSAYYGTKAKLHPAGDKLYATDNGITPDGLARYSAGAGTAIYAYDSPEENNRSMCGNLWLHEVGPLIYTACGNAYRATGARARDMVYAGSLGIEGATPSFGTPRIRSLSHSAESHEVVLIDDTPSQCDSDGLPYCSNLRLYDADYHTLVAKYRVLRVKVAGVTTRHRGRFVFHSADGAARYLISQLQPDGTYIVSTIDRPANVPDLSQPAPAVTASTEAGIVAAPLVDFAALPHDVVDAAFSAALNAIVMISTYPSYAVHVHDMATGSDRAIALTKEPRALSLSPDGMSASIAQPGLVTVVDLAPAGAAPQLLATATPGSTVMGGNGFVYVMPSTNARIRSINIATGIETQGSAPVAIGAYTTARLHPGGSKMYGYDTLRGELSRFPIVAGIADYGTHSPYLPNEHPMCGNQWFSPSGALIYTACGNTFAASDVDAEDMQYVATLELSGDGSNVFYRITALSDNTPAQEVALVEYAFNQCTPGPGFSPELCAAHLNLYDNASFARTARYSFSPLTVRTSTYPQLGRFVFHSADGTQRYVVSQLLEMPNPATEFYISRLP